MRVSLIQMNSIPDKDANLASAERLIEEAVAADRPDMVVLPEMFTYHGGTLPDRRANAEAIPGGRSYALLQGLARRHRVILHGGSMYERDGDAYYNTTVVFDRDGAELARYRKIHMFDVVTPDGTAYRESDTVARGGEVVDFKAGDVGIGLSICYDIRFGELYRELARRGVRIIAIPAAFTLQTGKDHWEVLCRARAIETQAYVLATGQVGSYPAGNETRWNWGHSMVVDPWGHIIAQAHDKVGFVSARLDLGYQDTIRQRLPVHQHHVL